MGAKGTTPPSRGSDARRADDPDAAAGEASASGGLYTAGSWWPADEQGKLLEAAYGLRYHRVAVPKHQFMNRAQRRRFARSR